ncbi:MAG: rRNA maturation RNase YbeY [Deltaproteobacteria bacterium]
MSLSIDLRAPAREGRASASARRWLGRWVALLVPGEACALSLWLTGDRTIHRLNRRFLGVDRPTDVLSFPSELVNRSLPLAPSRGLGDGKGSLHRLPAQSKGRRRQLGDLVVSLETTRRRARALGLSFDEELARYLAHGLLHLLGHDHDRPGRARRMATLERELLGAAGLIERAGQEASTARSRRR